MNRCHDGTIDLIPTTEQNGTPAIAACCAVCQTVLAVGPRSEVCAEL